VLIDAGELGDDRYRANPVDRCYWCKTNLYARIRGLTADPIASGTNRDDLDDFRPGLRAAAERGVVHPYVDAGIDKATVYALAAGLGLDDLERLPAQPCLSSRVETGIAIDPADLAFIDAVEATLAARLGGDAVLRCRITHAGVAIEVGDDAAAAAARAIGEDACARADRAFAGVRPYRRGAAFLRVTQIEAPAPSVADCARGESPPRGSRSGVGVATSHAGAADD
jgi:pyridinium-3,5-biscarboxylic acid mononucleotide sulfurtransferase